MKKTIMLLGMVSCILFQNLAAQQADINFGELSKPVPTVSSLTTYNNVPLTNATGLPEISIPLLQLPSRSTDIPLGVSLSYNLLNIKRDEPAADIGTGWSLFSGGVISRHIVDELDEMYYDVTLNGYKKNPFDDIYYYNIPGVSGKFRFIRDVNANTFQLINLSANKVKIEYTRTSNTATLVLDSFTITDAKGNKFFFNDYNLANLNGDLYGGSNEYRSAFFLTKIVDASNVEVASFTYEKRSKSKYYLPTLKIYQYCKLKTITSPDFGKIEYDYIFSEPWKMNDPFQVQKITLKDKDGHIISGYSFDYSYFQYEDEQLAGGAMEYIYKRALEKIKKLDKNGAVSETTEITYNYSESDPSLKRLIPPAGGAIEYDFNGGRVNTIKYYNFKTDITPVKTIRYDYSSFADPNVSSGKSFLIEMAGDNESTYNLYRNVKVIEDNNGYIKYYYKTPDNYPQVPYAGGGANDKFWPYYSITGGGLLEKKEVYDAQNKLLLAEQNDYVFEDIPGSLNYQLFYVINSSDKIYSKSAWLKKSSVTSTSYFDNSQSIEEQSETNFNVFNYEVSSTKKVADGNTIEQFYTYPETGYANLAAAHILNTPVVVEEKVDGKLISRTETQFANPASTRPTAIISSNIGNTAQKTATIDLYDEKGNVIQITVPEGKVTTTIYGYNKTLPIAKIEGAAYTQVSPYIQAIVDASNADALNPANETALLIELDNFRKSAALQNTQITTYTYDPLIGATTATPPDGIRAIYKYDNSNRLQKIVDMNGVILKEYQYNYKN